MGKQRIAYIDAMRGLTMILVVYAHICHFCLGDATMGFNRVFFLFRQPCFFFISGWLFEPVCRRPFLTNVRHKAMVQIVPTFIFLLLLAPPPAFFHQLGTLKGGYWFTFVLFEFFVIDMLFERAGHRWSVVLTLLLTVVSFYYDAVRHQFLASPYNQLAGGLTVTDVLGIVSFPLWRYFLFFFVGTRVHRHFDTFTKRTDRPVVFAALLLLFGLVAATPHFPQPALEALRFYVGGISGMFLVFTCFRYLYTFLKLPAVFRHLEFVGTRTLDIYLLHYFFLPLFLLPYTDRLKSYDSQLVEFLFAMAVALIVLALSLVASHIIRLSPFLAHYLFGTRR